MDNVQLSYEVHNNITVFRKSKIMNFRKLVLALKTYHEILSVNNA